MSNKRVEFLASIPPLQSALTVAGDGGARLKLDLDEMQVNIIPQLLSLRGRLLKVTIELEDERQPEKSRKIHI